MPLKEGDVGLKLRPFKEEVAIGEHIRRNDNEPTYHQLGQTDDLRLGHSNYHVSNQSSKDW